jgi:hypothetical protein
MGTLQVEQLLTENTKMTPEQKYMWQQRAEDRKSLMKSKTFGDATEVDSALGLHSAGFDFNFNAPHYEEEDDDELA